MSDFHNLFLDIGDHAHIQIFAEGTFGYPDLVLVTPLEREGAIDFPNTSFHKLIFISKYRDNSILRDEVAGN